MSHPSGSEKTAHSVDELHLWEFVFCKCRSNQCQLSINPMPALLTPRAPDSKSNLFKCILCNSCQVYCSACLFMFLCILCIFLYFDSGSVSKFTVDTEHRSPGTSPHIAAMTNAPLIDSLLILWYFYPSFRQRPRLNDYSHKQSNPINSSSVMEYYVTDVISKTT